jgi:hypothetical protein
MHMQTGCEMQCTCICNLQWTMTMTMTMTADACTPCMQSRVNQSRLSPSVTRAKGNPR